VTATASARTPEPRPRRWWRWRKLRRLQCADNHHFPYTFRIPEGGFIQCKHWIADEKRECAKWVYIAPLRGGMALVVDVHLSELPIVEQMQTASEILEYLGIFDTDAPLTV
jgi:hypothetical protein